MALGMTLSAIALLLGVGMAMWKEHKRNKARGRTTTKGYWNRQP